MNFQFDCPECKKNITKTEEDFDHGVFQYINNYTMKPGHYLPTKCPHCGQQIKLILLTVIKKEVE